MDFYIKNGMAFLDGRFRKADITVKNGRIASLEGMNADSLPEVDAEGMRVVPGFIDIHTHGGAGVDINHANSDDLVRLSHFFASQGTTSFLASIATDTEKSTLQCINGINQAMTRPDCGAEILGTHLEGPFLAPEYKGAMPEHLLLKAGTELFFRFHNQANGGIRFITVSPEVEGVPELIEKISGLGVVIAIGHSGADYETAQKCIALGAACSTHTFNGMKWMHQHAPAISGAILESDIYCEAICDGRHLHPGIVRLLIKTKGLDRVVAVTDSTMAAGLPDGRYVIGVNDIEVVNGDAKLVSNGMRAGSTLTMISALKNLVNFTGRSLEELLPLLTSNPAELMKINERKGTIAIDKDADLVLLDADLNIDTTIARGNIVYKSNARLEDKNGY